ncbi:TRAP transporter substrate-binding protein [Crenobacter luteus]|uniref:TRAP transporter substrate-binding protein n=1 Tax=Crenobacter luteus TaxID=1452487 RepID=UPI0009EEAD18
MKSRCIAALALLTALALAGCSGAHDEIVIKFSHVVTPDTPKGMAAERFRQLAEARTGGRVKVRVYPNSQLYKDKEELEALQLGAVQMLAPSLAKIGALGVREFEAFDLPYLFDSYASLHKVTDGPLGRRLLARLESRGIRGLAFWDNGFKDFSANRPLRTPADFKGLKMRIQGSTVLEEQMRALGAQPQVIAFSEAYPALAAGVVDGTENPPSNLYTQNMHRVQRHLTRSQHGYLGYVVIVNKKFWDDLPRDVRTILEGAMRDATAYANRIAKDENDKDLALIRASGLTVVHEPTPAERAALRRALLPVHATMADYIGRDVLDALYRETGFTAGR